MSFVKRLPRCEGAISNTNNTDTNNTHNKAAGVATSREASPVNSIPKDCATSNYKRVIQDPSVWRFMQNVYIETVDGHGYSRRREKEPSYSGFTVEVVVKDDGKRGRSVYAAEPIRKGTRVWKSTHLVTFETPQQLHSFLGMLDHDLQCDALLWAYVEKGAGYVSLALDPASFVNHGETEEVVNLDEDCFALRDISIGEELLEDYSHFIGFGEEEGVEWYHQIRGRAWQEGELGSHQAKSTDEYNLLGAPKVWKGSNGGGDGIISSMSMSSLSSVTAELPVWLSAFGLLVVVTLVLNRCLFFRSGKKEKEGL
eukprot:CAMPEP_0168190662 /NCGR_PEP_ID=MMETSP0139_2-20121125/17034_1 /TAXON_ID=44445 /ORGANISM="Pseudo-nitzschia australis, Strain 10249 10 AB" /LENGTH=311 /DNA_ID=CAMNT_0008113649 /DNA_START=261 /DNA_END=1195 /DNA_ORIENTATION=+